MTSIDERTLRAWYELPPETWRAGAPRRVGYAQPHVNLFGDDCRTVGRTEGLHPLEEVCRAIQRQAEELQQRARRREWERKEAQYAALHTARLFRRMEPSLGLATLDCVADLQDISREEVAARLELAATLMERDEVYA